MKWSGLLLALGQILIVIRLHRAMCLYHHDKVSERIQSLRNLVVDATRSTCMAELTYMAAFTTLYWPAFTPGKSARLVITTKSVELAMLPFGSCWRHGLCKALIRLL